MLIPLFCVVFIIQSLNWRLLDENQVPLYESGTWFQTFFVWAAYLAVLWAASWFFQLKTTSKFKPYGRGALQVLSAGLFVYLVPWGMKASETFFLATYAHFSIELRTVWEWVAIAPFLVGQLIILRRPNQKGSLRYAFRYLSLILMPYLMASIFLEDSLWDLIFTKILGWKYWEITFEKYALEWPLMCFVISCMIILLPFIAQLILILKPLPLGQLRDSLIEQSENLGVRYRELLIWDAGPGQANAAVMGTLPFSRYVLITEEMINTFSLERIQLVFWHELGHIVQRHLWTHYLFFMIVPGVLIFTHRDINIQLDLWQESLLTIFIWAIGFSYLSRLLEKHADLYAVKKTARVDEYQELLYSLSSSTGISPRFFSLTHGSTQGRIDFLKSIVKDSRRENAFQNKIRSIQWFLVLVFIAQWAYWFTRFVVS